MRRAPRPTPSRIASPPHLIWSTPVVDLERRLREEAQTVRTILGAGFREADLLESIAERIRLAVRKGAEAEYVRIEDAARMLDVCVETVRRRCVQKYQPIGLAAKRGGIWYVHVSALTGSPDRMNSVAAGTT